MQLNLVPWCDDTHIEVRMFRDGVNAFTGIFFTKKTEGWELNLNEEYRPAAHLAKKSALSGSHFKYLTAGFNRVQKDLSDYA